MSSQYHLYSPETFSQTMLVIQYFVFMYEKVTSESELPRTNNLQQEIHAVGSIRSPLWILYLQWRTTRNNPSHYMAPWVDSNKCISCKLRWTWFKNELHVHGMHLRFISVTQQSFQFKYFALTNHLGQGRYLSVDTLTTFCQINPHMPKVRYLINAWLMTDGRIIRLTGDICL